jgi:hypothetical protein
MKKFILLVLFIFTVVLAPVSAYNVTDQETINTECSDPVSDRCYVLVYELKGLQYEINELIKRREKILSDNFGDQNLINLFNSIYLNQSQLKTNLELLEKSKSQKESDKSLLEIELNNLQLLILVQDHPATPEQNQKIKDYEFSILKINDELLGIILAIENTEKAIAQNEKMLKDIFKQLSSQYPGLFNELNIINRGIEDLQKKINNQLLKINSLGCYDYYNENKDLIKYNPFA